MKSEGSLEVLEIPEATNLKVVEYKGFGESRGEVVYRIEGNKVLFSATKGSTEATSTINAAENVIKAICDSEGIDWRKSSFCKSFEFYDLTTPVGYPHRLKPDIFEILLGGQTEPVQILKLEVVPDNKGLNRDILVNSWTRASLPTIGQDKT